MESSLKAAQERLGEQESAKNRTVENPRPSWRQWQRELWLLKKNQMTASELFFSISQSLTLQAEIKSNL